MGHGIEIPPFGYATPTQERNNSTHNCRNAQLVSAQVSFTHTKTRVLSGLDKLRSGGHAAIGVGVGKRLLRGTFRTLIPLSLSNYFIQMEGGECRGSTWNRGGKNIGIYKI